MYGMISCHAFCYIKQFKNFGNFAHWKATRGNAELKNPDILLG